LYKVRSLIIIALVFFVALIIPIFALIDGILNFPEIGAPTFTFLSFIESSYAAGLVATTLEFSVAHAILAVAIAIFYAWVVAKSDIPWKGFFELLPILGLTLPLEVKSFAWIFLGDPHVGLLNTVFRSILGPFAPTIDIYGMGGMIWVAMLGGVPLSYLIIMPAMKSLDSSLEEASRVAGKGTLHTFFSVTFRLLLPAVGSAFLLAVIAGLANFDYPYFLGQPAGVHTLSTEVYYWVDSRAPPSYGSAGVLSILYVMITMVALTFYIWSTRRTYRFAVVTGRAGRQIYYKLRRWKPVFVLGCFVVIFFEFILPFIAVLLVSSSNIFFTNSLTNVQFDFPASYITTINLPYFYSSLTATFEFGLGAATIVTVASALLSFAALKNKARGSRLIEYITSIPLAFPGVVYSVALTWMFLIVPGLSHYYGTLLPLIISLTFIRLPFGTRIISGNLVQISNELEEASQVGGSRFTRTFARITVPLMRNGVINAFVYSLVDSLRELGGVVLITSPSALAFTALLLDYYGNHTGNGASVVAAGSTILVGLIVVLLVVLGIAQHFLGGRHRS
jgi:iron(III) transport system permease protein